jgi:TonB family protein
MMPIIGPVAILLCLTQAANPARARTLIPEFSPKVSSERGVVSLGGSRGWLRTARPLLDFEVVFEFRALTPDAEPGLMIRTHTDPIGWPFKGYRLSLPTNPTKEVASLFVGRKQKVSVHHLGKVHLRPGGEWQHIVVKGNGQRIRLTLNDTLVGEFDIESFGGHVMFDNRKGRVELRNIQISGIDAPIAPGIPTDDDIVRAGGEKPRIKKEVRPLYTRDAMRAKAKGIVLLEAVVQPDGLVGPVRVTKSLHPDLDVAAAAALKQWRFHPAVLNGGPVASVVEIEMTFRLR